ncbi:MAG: hypothetical protein KGI45_03310 [Patescibacteria group bacterium]|nr:hypothetical protein [Patescibacteria group bacterium]MDE1940605.1 hypothetical protein [Patescibacteria group bacterium]MDE1967070.1 hypothetical protein [Patescibacteria group bacterium]
MKIVTLSKTVRTFQRFGEEESDAVEPTGPIIPAGTRINVGYIAEFNFGGRKQSFVRVFGCGEKEYDRDYFVLILEMENKELSALVPVEKSTAHLFTPQGREEVATRLKTTCPDAKWQVDESGFRKEGDREIIPDLTILNLLFETATRQQVFDWRDFADVEKLQDSDCRDCD